MNPLQLPESVRSRVAGTVVVSALFPGAGHFLLGRAVQGVIWFVAVQALLFGGIALAQGSQLDYGTWFQIGDLRLVFLLLPEMGNFLGTQVVAGLFHSVELGGTQPQEIPLRELGYIMSGAAGILAAFAAAHAAGIALATSLSAPGRRPHPGTAALASLLVPGLGHLLTGRRFKGYLLGGTVLGLFLLGMALGDFADMDRQRHPYYWAGQMMLGGVGWVVGLFTSSLRFERLLPFQDAGLLFVTTSGLFVVIVSLDAWHRAAQDWAAAAGLGKDSTDEPDETTATSASAVVLEGEPA